jgi:hypothetical protein
MSIFEAVLWIFLAAQLYWAWRIAAFLKRRIPDARKRYVIEAALVTAFLLYVYVNHDTFELSRNTPTAIHLTVRDALLTAPFLWWFAASVIGFLVAVLLSPVQIVVRIVRNFRSEHPPDRARRGFLEQGVAVATGAPFVAGAYGLFYGRLNLETTQQRIHLPNLPKGFRGLRIAQLSDIHIGPFMPQEQIRKYVAIANAQKPDLIVLTGDFVSWDPATQQPVVDALSGLRAPLGIYGCLGNHDAWAGSQDSITALFQQAGIHILRHARVPIVAYGESINLMGVDYQRDLEDIGDLLALGRVNILLSHNPNTFDQAAMAGVDLTLSGHTHGGQASLEFISPNLAPSRLVTPYVAGHFQQPGGQLYVNRGIGTIGIPIRLGAPPEITVFEL